MHFTVTSFTGKSLSFLNMKSTNIILSKLPVYQSQSAILILLIIESPGLILDEPPDGAENSREFCAGKLFMITPRIKRPINATNARFMARARPRGAMIGGRSESSRLHCGQAEVPLTEIRPQF